VGGGRRKIILLLFLSQLPERKVLVAEYFVNLPRGLFLSTEKK